MNGAKPPKIVTDGSAVVGRKDLRDCGRRHPEVTARMTPSATNPIAPLARTDGQIEPAIRGGASAPQMRHPLGGEQVHVPPRQIVREDAELEECHEDAEASALPHPLNPRPHGLGATDQSGAAPDEAPNPRASPKILAVGPIPAALFSADFGGFTPRQSNRNSCAYSR